MPNPKKTPAKQTVPDTVKNTVEINSATELMHLCGVADAHLRAIETLCTVSIRRRGGQINLSGQEKNVRLAAALIVSLRAVAHQTIPAEQLLALFHENKLALSRQRSSAKTAAPSRPPTSLLRAQSNEKASNPARLTDEESAYSGLSINSGRKTIRPRTHHQIAYLQSMDENDLVFGLGPAGTGKTYLAVALAVAALEQGRVQKIVLTRPAIEAGEKLGFLPGSLAEKVDPYLRPVYDALYDMLGSEKFLRTQERGLIEIAPLAFMRGRTLNEAFVILDEAQNTTPEQMKMFLTRIGYGTKVMVNGDLTQTDLPPNKESGLAQAAQLLKKIDGVGFVHFDRHDVVRHPLVAKIIHAYESL